MRLIFIFALILSIIALFMVEEDSTIIEEPVLIRSYDSTDTFPDRMVPVPEEFDTKKIIPVEL
jgi:hypothetical protein